MAKKESVETPVLTGQLKLYNNRTKELLIIADDELKNYDVRVWRVL